jgi:hypothetical protein
VPRLPLILDGRTSRVHANTELYFMYTHTLKLVSWYKSDACYIRRIFGWNSLITSKQTIPECKKRPGNDNKHQHNLPKAQDSNQYQVKGNIHATTRPRGFAICTFGPETKTGPKHTKQRSIRNTKAPHRNGSHEPSKYGDDIPRQKPFTGTSTHPSIHGL